MRPSVGPLQTVPQSGHLSSLASSAWLLPLEGGGKRRGRGLQEGSRALGYAEASANPKFPGWDFPRETARQ